MSQHSCGYQLVTPHLHIWRVKAECITVLSYWNPDPVRRPVSLTAGEWLSFCPISVSITSECPELTSPVHHKGQMQRDGFSFTSLSLSLYLISFHVTAPTWQCCFESDRFVYLCSSSSLPHRSKSTDPWQRVPLALCLQTFSAALLITRLQAAL